MVDTLQPQGFADFQKPLGVVATKEDAAAEMEHNTNVFCGEWGWMSRKISAPPAEGEKCS